MIGTNLWKGERILDRIADRYELYATNLEKAIELDGTMICHSAEPHPRRDEYYLNLDKETLGLVKRTSMKVYFE